MTAKMFAMLLAGILIGVAATGVLFKIYVDNLHHVACKMYMAVDNKSTFQYVNTQFRCQQ